MRPTTHNLTPALHQQTTASRPCSSCATLRDGITGLVRRCEELKTENATLSRKTRNAVNKHSWLETRCHELETELNRAHQIIREQDAELQIYRGEL